MSSDMLRISGVFNDCIRPINIAVRFPLTNNTRHTNKNALTKEAVTRYQYL